MKRAHDKEELEIDLEAPAPASKKELRLLKKAKKLDPDATLEEIRRKEAKNRVESATLINDSSDLFNEPSKEIENESKPLYGVWIGNLAYETTKTELVAFLNEKIRISAIVRVNIPYKHGRCKGFAYVDFEDAESRDLAIAMSESELLGRNLLIKDAYIDDEHTAKSAAPATKLYVGNLPAGTTKSNLKEHFGSLGEIKSVSQVWNVRKADFTTAYAFVNFVNPDQLQTALTDSKFLTLEGKTLNLSAATKPSKGSNPSKTFERPSSGSESREPQPARTLAQRSEYRHPDHSQNLEQKHQKPEPVRESREKIKRNEKPHPKRVDTSRPSGKAKGVIVAGQGKKITF
ncbi:hypothetical protein CANCADRAFT_105910 [Tortispora caseinolytica NRRL Y-17796]|uniref:RRM domain-containing protein n=1 Tax=Tortispora caseinolytica NRRL Y-17796 TaxID=767744 RepID=A0A1E4TF24_9ASCO|nr:hypothetical protein CANCADRAFT_105910 [Tortispora caseinolytica NRRL Y-17796]